jgi:hypothetical protein
MATREFESAKFCVLVVAVLVSLLATIIRIAPLGGPIVFADEYSYAALTDAAWKGIDVPAHVPAVGNWIFIALYSIVHVSDQDPLLLARLLNAVVAGCVAIPVMLIASRAGGLLVGFLLAVSLAALFVGGMAAYFMPEVLYYAWAIAAFWALMRYIEKPSIGAVMFVALFLSVVSLSKTHGILLLPGFFLTVTLSAGWVHWIQMRERIFHGVVLVAATLVMALAIKGGLSGVWSMDLLGRFYGGLATSSLSSPLKPGSVFALTAQHVAVVFLLVGPYLVLCGLSAVRFLMKRQREESADPVEATSFAALGSLIGMLVLTVMFSVSIAGSGGYENLDRLHGRYYEHLLYLCAALGVISLPATVKHFSAWQRYSLAATSLLSIWIAFFALNPLEWQYPNDFSGAIAFTWSPLGIEVAAVLGSIAAVSIGMLPRWSTIVSAFALAAWLAFNAFVLEAARWSAPGHPADVVGNVLATVEREDPSRAVIHLWAEGHSAEVYRLAFWLMDEDVRILVGADRKCPSPEQGVAWIVMVGEAPIACAGQEHLLTDSLGVVNVRQGFNTSD